MAIVLIDTQTPAMSHESITVSSTPIGITTAVHSTTTVSGYESPNQIKRTAKSAYISVETNSIRFTLDGTTVSSTAGHLLAAGDTLMIYGHQNVRKLSMARVTNDATVKVTTFA